MLGSEWMYAGPPASSSSPARASSSLTVTASTASGSDFSLSRRMAPKIFW
jgi:hypothetical protein